MSFFRFFAERHLLAYIITAERGQVLPFAFGQLIFDAWQDRYELNITERFTT